MIKIQNGLLILPEFSEAIQELMSIKIDVKSCLLISTVIEDIEAQIDVVNRSKRMVINKYCIKDEKGSPKIDAEGSALFDNDEIREQCLKDIEDIMVEKFELRIKDKIKIPGSEEFTTKYFILLKDIISVEE